MAPVPKPDNRAPQLLTNAPRAASPWPLRRLVALAIFGAIALCGLMLLVGAIPLIANHFARELSGWARRQIPWLSALPLLLGGAAYIVLQAIAKPRPLELLKRLMLGAAFLLWGIVQLMPPGDLATELGNVVISLYVIDLGLMIRSDLLNIA